MPNLAVKVAYDSISRSANSHAPIKLFTIQKIGWIKLSHFFDYFSLNQKARAWHEVSWQELVHSEMFNLIVRFSPVKGYYPSPPKINTRACCLNYVWNVVPKYFRANHPNISILLCSAYEFRKKMLIDDSVIVQEQDIICRCF